MVLQKKQSKEKNEKIISAQFFFSGLGLIKKIETVKCIVSLAAKKYMSNGKRVVIEVAIRNWNFVGFDIKYKKWKFECSMKVWNGINKFALGMSLEGSKLYMFCKRKKWRLFI